MGTMPSMDTEAIRQNLNSESDRLNAIKVDLRSADDLDSETPDSGRELSNVDNHPADNATDQQQREVDLSLLEQVESELEDVERAMQKLDEGTYGVCEVGGEEIPAERLEVQPAARFCAQHAQ